MRALLAVGLVNAHGKTIAPRMLAEDGTLTIGGALPRDGSPLDARARVTYLAQHVPGPGCYDVEIADDGTPIMGNHAALTPSEHVRSLFAARGWSLPPGGES